ncbi:Uncharacterised protein [Actinobaculum suis]|uniref:FtsX-like permease family protein n=1 Tax=Actinobaculum suis TaxID=1657 RepID=A0A7Z8YA00_9ACTO|nr:Uncharacterised protein [Actinobaculum suis]
MSTNRGSGPNDDVVAYMRYLQEKREAVAIAHSRQNILSTDTQKAASVDVTSTSGPADIGVVIAGRYPIHTGEFSVSSAVAKQLQAELGARFEMVDADNAGKQKTFTLVGVTENPASINEINAIAITDDETVFSSAEVWLTNDDLAPINGALSHGGGDVATVTSVVNRSTANAVSYQAVSPQMAFLFGGLMVVAFVTAIYAADRQRRQGVYRVLTALGDSPGKAALTTCTQTILLALLGGAVGVLIAVISLPNLSAWLGTYFEQRWQQLVWSAVVIAATAMLAVILLGGILAAGLTVAARKHQMRAHSDGFSVRLLMGVGVAGTAITMLLIISRQLYIFPQGHRAAMVVGAVSVPAFAYAIALITRQRKVTGRLGNRLQKLTLGALVAVFALNYYGALYASGVADLTNWLGRQIEGADSYLEVSNANEQAVDNLLKRFPEIKPYTAVFGDVATNERVFRITDSESAACFATAKTVADCPQPNLDLVYIASGGLVDRKYINHAPESYVTKKGAVTLIGIGMGDSAVTEVINVEGIIGDRDLENNILRGLVLSSDSPLLKQLGISKPRSYTVIVTGFGSMPDEVRDGVRATILLEAPFASLSDSDDPEIRQLRAQAVARQIFAVFVSGAILLALAVTLVSDQRIERRLIELFGGGRRVRLRLLKPLVFSYSVTVGSAVILGRLAAMDRIPFTFLDSAAVHNYGVVWTFGLAGLLFVVPALIIGARPRRLRTGR